MKLIIWILMGLIFGYWSYLLAQEKGKPSPQNWAIAGFLFNIIPVIALSAAHSKKEIRKLLEDSHRH